MISTRIRYPKGLGAQTLLAAATIFSFISCGTGKVEDVLYGYKDGSKQVKYESSFERAKLENGQKGFHLKSKTTFTRGTQFVRISESEYWLNAKYGLEKFRHSIRVNGTQEEESRGKREGNEYLIEKASTNGRKEKRLAYDAEALGTIHPSMYADLLKEPGSEKTFKVFYESEASYRSFKVRHVGSEWVESGKKRVECEHYAMESLSVPGSYDHYYLAKGSQKLKKITFEKIVFWSEELAP